MLPLTAPGRSVMNAVRSASLFTICSGVMAPRRVSCTRLRGHPVKLRPSFEVHRAEIAKGRVAAGRIVEASDVVERCCQTKFLKLHSNASFRPAGPAWRAFSSCLALCVLQKAMTAASIKRGTGGEASFLSVGLTTPAGQMTAPRQISTSSQIHTCSAGAVHR